MPAAFSQASMAMSGDSSRDYRLHCSASNSSLYDTAMPQPRGALPKNSSLIFSLDEMDDSCNGPPSICNQGENLDLQLELRKFLQPATPFELKLRTDVEAALELLQSQQSSIDVNQWLAGRLGALGYDMHIRTALGGGEGYECLRNLRHTFLTARSTLLTGPHPPSQPLAPCQAMAEDDYVIDLSFRDQFLIAKPTPRYTAVLACLPAVHVAPSVAVAQLVQFMAEEIATAFKVTGTVLPPWRHTPSMMSKWLPRKSLDERVEEVPAPHSETPRTPSPKPVENRGWGDGPASSHDPPSSFPIITSPPSPLSPSHQRGTTHSPHHPSLTIPPAFSHMSSNPSSHSTTFQSHQSASSSTQAPPLYTPHLPPSFSTGAALQGGPLPLPTPTLWAASALIHKKTPVGGASCIHPYQLQNPQVAPLQSTQQQQGQQPQERGTGGTGDGWRAQVAGGGGGGEGMVAVPRVLKSGLKPQVVKSIVCEPMRIQIGGNFTSLGS